MGELKVNISNIYIWDGLKASLPCPNEHLQWVSCVWGGGCRRAFVWAEKPQTQQRPAVQRPTHGTMGWAQGGGWTAELSTCTLPAYPTHTNSPQPPSLNTAAGVFLFVAQRGSWKVCAMKTFGLLQLKCALTAPAAHFSHKKKYDKILKIKLCEMKTLRFYRKHLTWSFDWVNRF